MYSIKARIMDYVNYLLFFTYLPLPDLNIFIAFSEELNIFRINDKLIFVVTTLK
jgi:hypothetical protein